MSYYDNSGQINDEALSVAGGRTFQVIQLADSAGNIVDPAQGSVVFDGEVTISSEVEISNDSGNPIPISILPRTPFTSSVASSTSSVTILEANTDRKGVSIANDGSEILRLGFTSPVSSSNCFIIMQPHSFLMLDHQLIVSNALYGIWGGVSGTAQVTEFV
jgi:hypothetical protein